MTGSRHVKMCIFQQRTALKGVCHKVFDLRFFHDSNPSGPLINRLSISPRFSIIKLSLVAFKGRIRSNPFRGEHINQERKDLKYKILVYRETFLSPRCAAHRRDNFVI